MYITLEEAKIYVKEYYSSTSPLRLAWEQLSDEDKQVALNRAEQTIDNLPLKGFPTKPPKAFPREPFKEESIAAAKIATVELAVQRLDEEAAERYEMQKAGVKSYRIGDLSESFGAGAVSIDAGVDGLALSIVFPFLRQWLGGGYKICPQRIRRRW